jgi:hypothetical protein
LEAWLIDREGNPLAKNREYLQLLDNPVVVPELATFNAELNGSPSRLTGRVFSRLLNELAATGSACADTAEKMGWALVAIGILSMVPEEMLNFDNISDMVRYRSLNDRIIALRDGRPLQINIDCATALNLTRHDVLPGA